MDNHSDLVTNNGAHYEVNEKFKYKIPWFVQVIQWLANNNYTVDLELVVRTVKSPPSKGMIST